MQIPGMISSIPCNVPPSAKRLELTTSRF